MNKGRKTFKKFSCCAAVVLTVFCCSAHCFAAGAQQTKTITLGTQAINQSLEMWHYSGGYWKVGNDYNTAITIYDSQIVAGMGITGYLESTQYATFRIELPASWRSQIKAGDVLNYTVSNNGLPLFQIFDMSSFTGYYQAPYYYIKVKPIFVISKTSYIDHFVPGVITKIPMVHYQYGENLYSIYKGSSHKGAGRGWFSDYNENYYEQPGIHPIMIRDTSGAIKSGYTINNLISNFSSAGYSVGNGTFRNGGAVGMKFYFKLNATFTITRTETVTAPGTGEGPGSPPPPVIPDPPPVPPGGDESGDAEIEFNLKDWRIHRLK